MSFTLDPYLAAWASASGPYPMATRCLAQAFAVCRLAHAGTSLCSSPDSSGGTHSVSRVVLVFEIQLRLHEFQFFRDRIWSLRERYTRVHRATISDRSPKHLTRTSLHQLSMSGCPEVAASFSPSWAGLRDLRFVPGWNNWLVRMSNAVPRKLIERKY